MFVSLKSLLVQHNFLFYGYWLLYDYDNNKKTVTHSKNESNK